MPQYHAFYVGFVFVALTAALVSLLVYSSEAININQSQVKRRWDKVNDTSACPQTGRYLAWMTSQFSTWSFATASGSIMGLLLIILCAGYNLLSKQENRMRPAAIFVSCIIVVLINMFVSYKFLNCVLARFCNFGVCVKEQVPKK